MPLLRFEEFALSRQPSNTFDTSYDLRGDVNDWLSLLQCVAVKSKGHEMAGLLEGMIEQLSQKISIPGTKKEIDKRLGALLEKISCFFELLISKNGILNLNTNESEIRRGLQNIDDEVRRLFNEYGWAIKMLKSSLSDFLKSKLQDAAMQKIIDDFLDASKPTSYANVLLFIQVMMARHKDFWAERCAMKIRFERANFPPVIGEIFTNHILPLLQHHYMNDIENIVVGTEQWLGTHPNDTAMPQMLLRKIKKTEHITLYLNVLTRLDEIEFEHCQMTYDTVLAAGNLPLETVCDIVKLPSYTAMQNALEEADVEYHNAQKMRQKMESLLLQLTPLLKSKMIVLSEYSNLQRDGLYLHSLDERSSYYVRYDDAEKSAVAYFIKDISNLKSILKILIQNESDTTLSPRLQRRATLHILAILREIYGRVSVSERPTVEHLLWVLLILADPKVHTYLPIDMSESERSIIWAIFSGITCLRTGMVYIENPEQLLTDRSRLFLETLDFNIESIKCSDGPDVCMLKRSNCYGPMPASHSYYVALHSWRYRFNKKEYLDQALSHIKNIVLKYFDAWEGVLETPQDHYRKVLLNALDVAWKNSINNMLLSDNIEEIDERLKSFQDEYVMHIWQTVNRQLFDLCSGYPLTASNRARLAFLMSRSEQQFSNDLALKQYRLSAVASDNTLSEPVKKFAIHDSAAVILWYDADDLNAEEKQRLTNQHFKAQLNALLNKVGKHSSLYFSHEQFGSLIDYISEALKATNTPTAEFMAVVLACVNLYQSVDLDMKTDYDTNGRSLIQLSKNYYMSRIAKKLTEDLVWVTHKHSFYYNWLESNEVKRSAETIYALAQAVEEAPHDTLRIKTLHQALYYQKALLNRQSFYFSFAWFFGYVDIRDVLSGALNEFDDLVTLLLYDPNLRQEAYEVGLSRLYLEPFQMRSQQVVVSSNHMSDWQIVLDNIIMIQNQENGFGTLYELKDYLLKQRHIFMINSPYGFYGEKKIDQIDILLTDLECAILNSKSHRKKPVNTRLFLSKKESWLQTYLGSGVQEVLIKPGCVGGQDYFDVWITTDHLPASLEGFQQLSKPIVVKEILADRPLNLNSVVESTSSHYCAEDLTTEFGLKEKLDRNRPLSNRLTRAWQVLQKKTPISSLSKSAKFFSDRAASDSGSPNLVCHGDKIDKYEDKMRTFWVKRCYGTEGFLTFLHEQRQYLHHEKVPETAPCIPSTNQLQG